MTIQESAVDRCKAIEEPPRKRTGTIRLSSRFFAGNGEGGKRCDCCIERSIRRGEGADQAGE